MRITTLLNKLIGLQGLWVQGLEYEEDKGRVLVDVVPRRRRPRCGHCGRKVRKNKDRSSRLWRHLDLFGVRTYLRYRIRLCVVGAVWSKKRCPGRGGRAVPRTDSSGRWPG